MHDHTKKRSHHLRRRPVITDDLTTAICLLIVVFAVIFMLCSTTLHQWIYHKIGLYHQVILQYQYKHPFLFGLSFCLIFFLSTLMAIPITGLFNLLAGFIFGIIPTIVMVLISRTSASFLLFKFGRNTRYRHYIRKSSWWPAFRRRWRQYAVVYLLVLRIFPIIPSWSVSIAAGLLRLPDTIFLITTILGKLPGTMLYAYIGNHSSSLFNPIEPMDHPIWQTKAVWLPILIMLLCSSIPLILKKRSKRPSNHMHKSSDLY